jgi:hypothetical protein
MQDATGRLAFRVSASDGGATALQDDAGGVLVTVRSGGQVIIDLLALASVLGLV